MHRGAAGREDYTIREMEGHKNPMAKMSTADNLELWYVLRTTQQKTGQFGARVPADEACMPPSPRRYLVAKNSSELALSNYCAWDM
jgi:hypothetical protein